MNFPKRGISLQNSPVNNSINNFDMDQELSKTLIEKPWKKREKLKHQHIMLFDAFDGESLIDHRAFNNQQSSNTKQEDLSETFIDKPRKKRKTSKHQQIKLSDTFDEQSLIDHRAFNNQQSRNIVQDPSETLIEKPSEKRKKSKHQLIMPLEVADKQSWVKCNDLSDQHDNNTNQELSKIIEKSRKKTKKSKHRETLPPEVFDVQTLTDQSEFNSQQNSNVNQELNKTLIEKLSKQRKKSKHQHIMPVVVSDGQSLVYCNDLSDQQDSNTNQELSKTLIEKSKKKSKKSKHQENLLPETFDEQSLIDQSQQNSNTNQEVSETLVAKPSKQRKKSKHQHALPAVVSDEQSLVNCNDLSCQYDNLNQELIKTFNEKSRKKSKKSKHRENLPPEMFDEQSLIDQSEFNSQQNSKTNQKLSETLVEKQSKERKKSKHVHAMPAVVSDEQFLVNCNDLSDQHDGNTNQELNKSLIEKQRKKSKKSKHRKTMSSEIFDEQSLINCKGLEDQPNCDNQEIIETLTVKRKKSNHQKTPFEIFDVSSDHSNSSISQDIAGTLFGQPDKNKKKSKHQYEISPEIFDKQFLTNYMDFNDSHKTKENSEDLARQEKKKRKKSSKVFSEQCLSNFEEIANHSNNMDCFNDTFQQIEDNTEVQSHDSFEVENKKKKESKRVETSEIVSFFNPDIGLPDVGMEVLQFDLPVLHEKESVCMPSKEMLDDWKLRGIVIKTGKWSKEEIDLLKRNYNDYVTEHGINDPSYLFGIGLGKRSNMSLQYIKNTHFYARLGKDLNDRTLRSIYVKAREMFKSFKQDQADQDEVMHLKGKQMLLGNKWTKIGKSLDRSEMNCRAIFRWHSKIINKNKWTNEEIEQLKLAIETVSGTSDLSDMEALKNISWTKIAEFVPTRNYSQCYHYWGEHLAWDPSVECKRRWTKSSSAMLVSLLKNHYYVKDEDRLDWKEIQDSFKDVSPSYIFLQKQWRYLKSRAPRSFSYQQKVDFLYDKYSKKYNLF